MLTRNAWSPARAFAFQLRPAVLAPCSSFTTSFAIRPIPAQHRQPPKRALATRTVLRNAAPASSQPVAAQTPSAPTSLTWNDFFVLRRVRRRIGQACSGVSAIAVTYYGLTTVINSDYDSMLSAQLNADPFAVMGLCSIGMMSLGWLIGPFFGNQIFKLAYRGVLGDFSRVSRGVRSLGCPQLTSHQKESAFFVRIKRHRVDPTASSIANPAPDYHGEKISSVAGYRRWLKDQRAFGLKTGSYRASKTL